MRKFITTTICAAAIGLAACTPTQQNAAQSAAAPHLEKRGNVTQLIVNGEPYLALACELMNSSSSSREYMAQRWKDIKAAGVNTVLAVVSWEQIEPKEGVYDFTVVDDLIADARANDLKLALLWFGSWKNGISSYHPTWVKKDAARFPSAQTIDGKTLPILSTLGKNTAEADGKAYAAMMEHVKEIDSAQQTVIMIQMENEVGLHGYSRDYCPAANEAFNSAVPQALIDYLVAHKDSLLPETLAAWKNSNFKTSGTWEEVFGKGYRTDEIFMAWNYASYLNTVSAAGKAVYDLPTFVNAWIVQPEDTRPGNYPAGGPQAQNHDIWRAAAPAIDILSPDIYLPDFPNILRMYARNGNPVFVPESRAGQNGACNAAFLIGEMGGIGYSPFGFDRDALSPDNKTFTEFYNKVAEASGIILDAQAEGRIRASWVKGSNPTHVKEELVLGDYRIVCELVCESHRNGGAPQLIGGAYNPDDSGYAIAVQLSDDELLFLGSNIRITFLPKEGDSVVGLARVAEGRFENGKWIEGRILNGDQIQLRYDIIPSVNEGFSGQGLNFGTPHPEFIKVQLYNYE